MASDMTDKELILEWLEWFEHNQGRAVGSVNKYHRYIRDLSAWLKREHDTKLLKATQKQLESYAGLELHRLGMAPRSRRPVIAAIRGFYWWAKSQWYISSSPAESLPYPTAGRRLPKPMALQNAEKLLMQPDLDEFTGVRDAAIIAMFIGCGLRLAGLASLNESNLVWMKVDNVEHLIVRVIEKGDKERLIPAPHETRLLVRAYLGHPDMQRIDRSLQDGDQVLWVSVRNRGVPEWEYVGENRRFAERSIGEMIVKHADQAGIPRDQAHPHALRHLFATELTEDDVQQKKVQVLMGHSSSKSTEIYQHVAMRSLITTIDKSNPLAKMNTPVTDLVKRLTQ